MASSLIDGNSILAIDVGAANTRAVFFDVVEGEYRFVASGVAPSTAEAPYKDVSEGVRNAIQNLQSVLGRSPWHVTQRPATRRAPVPDARGGAFHAWSNSGSSMCD